MKTNKNFIENTLIDPTARANPIKLSEEHVVEALERGSSMKNLFDKLLELDVYSSDKKLRDKLFLGSVNEVFNHHYKN